ncbi:MAG: hypothetical protein HOA57_01725 [Candidatus Magasanikbacteria bacterium]|jgi:hypothetical protein|nr:hypothetical protein [Candidatus Magasanikbacteria bacterium]MBT4314718.1 hypothetical protein [Candidatus Magasanikbacteria bacterium]MBT4547495.1 hypothetical protein [Candidatus Magasanikbacteria bacterium]MBT6819073.1 hypothetical protein [Candidatus Magasanikbacteria bacterium]
MKKLIIPTLLIALGIACRFIPHMPNFAPIGAIALFGALYLPKKYALILPISAMFLSDIFIGFYSWQIMASVYLGFILTVGIGLIARKRKSFASVLSATLLSSVLFYIVTNFSVWAFGTMYIHNFAGLMQSYYMALPFFRNSLAGNLFYVGILVGGFEAVKYYLKNRIQANTQTELL